MRTRPEPTLPVTHTDYMTRWRKRRYLAGGPMLVDSTGTRRRIQALAVNGWSTRALSLRLGMGPRAVSAMATRRLVHRYNAEKIAALYDELADIPGPCKWIVTNAKTRGWLGPVWWDDDTIDDPDHDPLDADESGEPDEVVVDRLVSGIRVPGATRAERKAAAIRVVVNGMSQRAAAVFLGEHERTITRWVERSARPAA